MKRINEAFHLHYEYFSYSQKAASLKFDQTPIHQSFQLFFPSWTTMQYTHTHTYTLKECFVSKGFDIFQQRISRSLSRKNFLVDSTTKGRKESLTNQGATVMGKWNVSPVTKKPGGEGGGMIFMRERMRERHAASNLASFAAEGGGRGNQGAALSSTSTSCCNRCQASVKSSQ